MKSWLQDSGIEMYSTNNERKSVVNERFIRTLKNKIYEYNNTYHIAIKMKPVDVTLSTKGS